MYFKYYVMVVFMEFTKEYKKYDFTFYAKDKAHAEKIAREMLYAVEGLPEEDLQFDIKYLKPNAAIVDKLREGLKEDLDKVCKLYEMGSYSDYVTHIHKYNGYQVKFNKSGKIKEYLFVYNNRVFCAKYDNEKCYIDRNFVIVNYENNSYLFTNDLSNVISCMH